MDLDGYRTVESFLKKLNQLEEFYIDYKTNEIPYQGGSLAQIGSCIGHISKREEYFCNRYTAVWLHYSAHGQFD